MVLYDEEQWRWLMMERSTPVGLKVLSPPHPSTKDGEGHNLTSTPISGWARSACLSRQKYPKQQKKKLADTVQI